MRNCINLSIPQFKQAAAEIGEVRLSNILNNNFKDEIPSYDEIMALVPPKAMTKMYNKVSQDVLTDMAIKLSQKFNVPFQMDLSLPVLGQLTDDGKVILNPKKATADTAFHEFGHLLLNMVKQEYPASYSKVVAEAKKNKEIVNLVDSLYSEKTQEQRDMEIAATVLGREGYNQTTQNKPFFVKLWEMFSNMINKALGLEDKVTILPNTTLADLAKILVNNKKVDLSSYGSNEDQRAAASQFTVEYERGNPKQKKALDELRAIIDINTMLNSEETAYINKEFPGLEMLRVSTQLNKDTAFKYDGVESSIRTLSTDWGNLIDTLVGSALQGESLASIKSELANMETTGKLDLSVVDSVYKEIVDFKFKRPGSVFIAQVVPFNLEKNTAGAVDIIEIEADGTRTVWDVKSSKYSTQGTYDYTNPTTGDTKKSAYDKPFKDGKYSMKQKHSAQVSFYGGLLQSKGFRVDHYGIIPIYLSSINGNNVLEANGEPLYHTELGNFDMSQKHFMQGINDKTWEGNQITEKEDTDAKRLHERALKLLETEKKKLQLSGGEFSQARLNRINRIQEEITTIKSVIALEKFTDSLYDMFVEHITDDGAKLEGNFIRETEKVFANVRNSVYKDQLEIIGALSTIVDRVELYKETIEDIEAFYIEHLEKTDQPIEKDSAFYKIKRILDAFKTAQVQVNSLIKPAIAKELSKVENKELAIKIDAEIAVLKKRYDRDAKKLEDKYKKAKINVKDAESENQLEADKAKETKKLKDKFDAIVSQYLETLASEDNMLSMMTKGFHGINIADAFFTPIGHLPNPIVNSFYKTLKRKYAIIRSEMQEWGIHASAVVKEYDKKSGFLKTNQKIHDEMIVEVNGALQLISEIDYQKYFDERKKAMLKIEQSDKPNKTKYKAKTDWYRANTEELPQEDTLVKNPYTKEKIVLRKGIQTILEQKKAELLQEYGSTQNKYYKKSWIDWLNQNSFEIENGERYYTGAQFTMPIKSKYTNSKYASVYQKNEKYYNFLLASLAKAHMNYPKQRNTINIFELPSVHKGLTDRMTENGIVNALKHFGQTNFLNVANMKEEDAEIYGIEAYTKGQKAVPVMYQSRGIDSNEISRNLIGSIGVYLQASERYKVQKAIEPLAKGIMTQLTKAGEYELTADGRKKFFGRAEEIGLSLEKYEKKWGNNYTAMALEAFIDAEIYGVTQKKQTFNAMGKEIDGGKMANILMSAMSATSIMGKPLIALANTLQQNAMLLLEGAAGEFITKKGYKDASMKYISYEGQFIKDNVEGNGNSFIGQLVDLYDPMMGFKDHFGRDISGGAATRLIRSSNLYYMMRKGEHQIYVTSMIAMLMDKKVKNSVTGEETTLLDAYEMKDGVVQLKEGYSLPHGRIDVELKEKMDAMNQRLHGVYNSMDKTAIERDAAGRLITMFRKFVPTGIKKRYKSKTIDHNVGDITEGFYNTFVRVAIKETRDLIKFVTLRENDLTPGERANVKRFLMEAGMILALFAIVSLLAAITEGEDDKEAKKRLSYPLYLAFRLRSELMFYFNPPDFLRIMRTPTIAYSQIERVSKFISQLYDPFAEYQKDYGMWEKGDSKLYAKALKIFGINGYTANPDIAYKNLQLFTNM
jgi:hypothetical protein